MGHKMDVDRGAYVCSGNVETILGVSLLSTFD